ncbi:MAG: lipolytic protein G-D-S-L family [Parabacteroides sp.]|nr:lipolytic protein G-D-S-L family [Parabacteroides sp.]
MKKHWILLVLALCAGLTGYAEDKGEKQHVNVVFVGNSITQGALLADPAHEAPPVQAVKYLTLQQEVAGVKFSNQGVSGSTTVDFLPATQTLFLKVKQAADVFKTDKEATLVFSLMLGTNDSAIKGPNGSPVQPAQYKTNVKVIVDELLALYPDSRIVLHRPIWYSPNTYNGAMYLKEGLNRLERYFAEINQLVEAYAVTHPDRVYCGDIDGFGYFRTNYATELFAEEGNAGTFYLHPNAKGAVKLGELWGKALLKVVR